MSEQAQDGRETKGVTRVFPVERGARRRVVEDRVSVKTDMLEAHVHTWTTANDTAGVAWPPNLDTRSPDSESKTETTVLYKRKCGGAGKGSVLNLVRKGSFLPVWSLKREVEKH